MRSKKLAVLMPDTPETPCKLPVGIEAQTRNVVANLTTILSGLGLEHIAMARIYLRHFDADYAAMNEVYRGCFVVGRLPARTCVGVTGLAYEAFTDIERDLRECRLEIRGYEWLRCFAA
jgi:2-iminobutanoate/2-iminopropanoate deaminase